MLTPATVCALFQYSPDADTLTCVQATGDDASVLRGLAIKNGDRTTGWAVAHDTVMANSPASLDLAERADSFSPQLKSAMVSPLKREGKIVGALSVYSSSHEPFTDDHKYAMERISSAFVDAVDFVSAPVRATGH